MYAGSMGKGKKQEFFLIHTFSFELSSHILLTFVIVLQAFIVDRLVGVIPETPHDGLGSRKGCYKRHSVDNRGPADGVFIRT